MIVSRHILAAALITSAAAACLSPTVRAVEVTVSNDFGHCVLVYGNASVFQKRTVDGAFVTPIAVRGGDMNGDGNGDVVAVSSGTWGGGDGSVAWWENLGEGTGWTQRVIATDLDYAWNIHVADLDRDGDLDVLGAIWGGDAVVWWENDGGSGTNWQEHVIDGSFNAASAVHVADVNGDGHRDIVGVASHAEDIAWYENDGLNGGWTKHFVDKYFPDAYSVAADDVDADGDVDLVSASFDRDLVVWWENLDGSGTSWQERTVDGDFWNAYTVHLSDMDRDGDTDIVGGAFVSGGAYDDLVWWENTSGHGTRWVRHRVESGFHGIKGTDIADVDRDGDMDLLAASKDLYDVAWWENRDGRGLSWRKNVLEHFLGGARAVASARLNRDSEPDIIAGGDTASTIAWWENPITNRLLFLPPLDTQTVDSTIGCRLVITNTPFQTGATQYLCSGWTGTGDVPASGTLPVIEISALSNDTTVAWSWRRRYTLDVGVISNGTIDANSGWRDEGSQITITATPDYLHVFRVWTGDVSVAESTNNPLVLTMDQPRSVTAVFAEVDNRITATAGDYGAISPTGTVGVTDGSSAQFLFTPDPHYHVDQVLVDSSSVAFSGEEYTFLDVTSNHTIHVTFAVNDYELTVTSEYGETHLVFGPWMQFAMQVLDPFIADPRELCVADLDGDDHMDIVGMTSQANPMAWWRNEGNGTNWSRHEICTNVTDATAILPGDYNGDDSADMAAVLGTNGIYWIDHPTGGSNYVVHPISTNERAITAVAAFDANSDQTLDMFAVSRSDSRIVWWWNEVGMERWIQYVISTNVNQPDSIVGGDINGDRYADFSVASSATGEISWWRNTRGDGSLWTKHNVGQFTGVDALAIADMDTDGDLDILSSSSAGGGAIVWWENTDLVGGIWRSHIVESYIPAVTSLSTVDLDRDGDMDVVAADPQQHAIRWWENTERNGLSWTPRFINNSLYLISSAVVADFNNDEELDLAGTAPGISSVGWLENQTTGRVVLTPPTSIVSYRHDTQIYGFHAEPLRRNGEEQRLVTGWQGSGSVPAAGSASKIGPLALQSDSTLDWRWTHRYWVRLHANTNGGVTPATGWYAAGTNLSVSAAGSTGHAFGGWVGDVETSRRLDNPLALPIDAPKGVTADFVAGDYVIIAETDGSGTIVPSGAVGVMAGSTQVFAMLPDPQHAVSSLIVDGEGVNPRETHTFYSITGNHEIAVGFVTETAQTDTDGDGLPNVDEWRFNLDKYDPDTDDDGFGDYAEAVTGSDGTNAQSVFQVEIDSITTNGALVVSWQSITGRLYSVWTIRDLAAGMWHTVQGYTNRPGTGMVMSYTNRLPGATGHFRPGVRFP